jgi:hypothetical protein
MQEELSKETDLGSMPGRLFENYMYVRNGIVQERYSTGNMQDWSRRNHSRNSEQAVGINVIALDL